MSWDLTHGMQYFFLSLCKVGDMSSSNYEAMQCLQEVSVSCQVFVIIVLLDQTSAVKVEPHAYLYPPETVEDSCAANAFNHRIRRQDLAVLGKYEERACQSIESPSPTRLQEGGPGFL